jgi:LysM repeat protein
VASPAKTGGTPPFPVRPPGAPALVRVKISRLGRSLSAAALLTVVSVTIAPAQDVRADSSTHTVKRGDTLWDLAHAYLGDAYLWPEIYRLNTDQIEDPHWIYPGEILRLPGQPPQGAVVATNAPTTGPAPEVEEPPRRVAGPTVFTPRTLARPQAGLIAAAAPPPRVPIGDVVSAPFFAGSRGPMGPGKLLVGADIPGIDMPNTTANFQLYDKVLMTPPAGSVAAERERFVAYVDGPFVENVGQVVIPTALLQVVRPPQQGDAAVVEVLELYGQLDANVHVVPLDTTGAGASGSPVALAAAGAPTAKIRAIYREAVLPSVSYYVLFDLAEKDGMQIGDEVQVFRPRAENRTDIGPAIPEVPIASGQVVRVTRYGATARITSQEQPAIRVGESVRVTARMP